MKYCKQCGPVFKVLTDLIAEVRILTIGIGSTASEVDRKIPISFIEETDGRDSLRRDYGLIEIYFTNGPHWTVTGGAVELHRAASNSDLVEEFQRKTDSKFPKYVSWKKLTESMPAAAIPVRRDQGDFLEYRYTETKVSVMVVNNHDIRDEWPGHGDIWSISLG
jgi:hypothetical protein